MKKTIRKSLAFLLAVTVILSMGCFPAIAADESETEEIPSQEVVLEKNPEEEEVLEKNPEEVDEAPIAQMCIRDRPVPDRRVRRPAVVRHGQDRPGGLARRRRFSGRHPAAVVPAGADGAVGRQGGGLGGRLRAVLAARGGAGGLAQTGRFDEIFGGGIDGGLGSGRAQPGDRH